jgi:hypothetical protein
MIMRKIKAVVLAIIVCILAFQGILSEKVKGIEEENNVILLIDNSGSMRWTDPHRLSIAAVSMLLDTLEEGTNVNVIGFGERILSPYELYQKPSMENIKAVLSNIRFDNNYTDLKEGLKEALRQMEEVKGKKTIIVLADGIEEPVGGLTERHMSELYKQVDRAYLDKVKVHCIGLSDLADHETLGRIAFKTGGDYFFCSSPAELFDAYSKVLGNQSGFYTIENYTTDMKQEEIIRLSSFVDEVIIKVASFENKTPFVKIEKDGMDIYTDKMGDTYKVYRFDNTDSSEIKISSRDAARNMIVVQIKSSVKLNINTLESNMRIPRNVPLSIDISLEGADNVRGLHMMKSEGSVIESIHRTGDKFNFVFYKEKSGQYPVVITAYDGEGNIIALRNLDINVMEYPPFFYSDQLPETIITDKPFNILLKPMDDSVVTSATGEVIVDYGDSFEVFPLSYNEGYLRAQVVLKSAGEVKITTSVNGIEDNKSFSYYLPNYRMVVLEKPYVQLRAKKDKEVIRKNSSYSLVLELDEVIIYQSEKVSILDSGGKKIGEFTLAPESKGPIIAEIRPVMKGNNIKFTLKPEGDISITETISSNIRVLSPVSYYMRWFRVPGLILITALLIAAAVYSTGLYVYNNYISTYKTSRELLCSIDLDGVENIETLKLSLNDCEKYLNLSGDNLKLETLEDNAVGQFVLYYPRGNKLLQGLKYILYKEKLFYIEYIPIIDQDVFRRGNLLSGPLTYEREVEIYIKTQRKSIRISFM